MNLTTLQDYSYRSFIVLIESAKLRGNIEDATLFSLIIIYSLKQQLIENNHTNNNQKNNNDKSIKILLLKYKILIITPPIPLSYNITLQNRNIIVEDLIILKKQILKEKISLSVEDLLIHITDTPFYYAHQGLNDLNLQVAINDIHAAWCPDLHYIWPNLPSEINNNSNNNNNNYNNNNKLLKNVIKIGFVSSHFHNHSIGRMLVELMVYLKEFEWFKSKNEKIIFEIIIYQIDRRFHGDVNHANQLRYSNQYKGDQDEITRLFNDHFGHNYVILPCNISVIRSIIGRDDLSFLFYSDIGMDFVTYALAYSRLATYQAVWWGHPITTGMNTIDYFIGLDDEILTAGDDQYSEQLIRMNYVNTEPMRKMDIAIKEHVTSKIMLGKDIEYGPDMTQKMINQIRFVDYSYYMTLLEHSTAVLDTFPYGGCLTTHDALSHGIPMVTLPSMYLRGRFTMSMYRQMNHMELIATNTQHFIQLIVNLTTNVTFHHYHTHMIKEKFDKNIHKNDLVAKEWLEFITRLFI
eukprot:gene8930-12043_t